MTSTEKLDRHLPLTEAGYYILLALAEPLHGYGVMQKVKALSRDRLDIGPGTLYGVLAASEEQGLIVKVREEERRKVYTLTALGRRVLLEQIIRLEVMARSGREVAGGA
jgi:DNA-binding PadR family transcriptional regulator